MSWSCHFQSYWQQSSPPANARLQISSDDTAPQAQASQAPHGSASFSVNLSLSALLTVFSCEIYFMGWVSVCVSHVQLFVTPWAVAHQAPLSMGFSRQEGNLPDSGIEPRYPALQTDSLPSEPLLGQKRPQMTGIMLFSVPPSTPQPEPSY